MEKISFGTDGWRATMADQFTFAHVRLVSQAIADYLKEEGRTKQGIVIGYDNRFLAENFAKEVARVLIGNGLKVYWNEQPVPTPVVAYAVQEEKADGAIMLTASHNPPEHNGMKFIPYYAGPALPAVTAKIEAHLADVLAKQEVQMVDLEELDTALIAIQPKNRYLSRVKELLDAKALQGLKIVYDGMHGVGSGYLDVLLTDLGADVSTMRTTRDAFFGGSLPEPTDANLAQLKTEMKKHQAIMGLANDGDADRFGVIDSNGDYITPNQVLVLVADHLLKRGQKGAIVRTVATTHMLDRIAAKHGLELIETPVGFKYVGGMMLEKEVLVGGEESGGLSIIGHIPEKDGILASALVAEIVGCEKKSLTEVLADLYREYGHFCARRWDVRCSAAEKSRILTAIKTLDVPEVAGSKVVQKITVDGMKMVLADGRWFLIRPSGTENLIRIYAEAGNLAEVERLQTAVKAILGL